MGLKRKPKSIVSFEDEIIKKDDADNLLRRLKKTESDDKSLIQSEPEDPILSKKAKKKHKKELSKGEIEDNHYENTEQSLKIAKKKKRKNAEEILESNESDEIGIIPKKSKKNKKINRTSENTEQETSTKSSKKAKSRKDENKAEDTLTEDKDKDSAGQNHNDEVTKPKPESKRSLKRKKHVKLLEEKKLKADLKMQQGVLNYLSKWKHARGEWKFEKLKQIWLQQNLFVVSKIPEEFWESTLEYFNGSKGAIRKVIFKEGLKIIEEDDKSEVDNDDEEYLTRLRRAREIVQSLEE